MNKKLTALVTGSNKGIGKAIADKFEENGFEVIRNGISDSNQKNYMMAEFLELTHLVNNHSMAQV